MIYKIIATLISFIPLIGGCYFLYSSYFRWRFPMEKRERIIRSIKAGIGLAVMIPGFIMIVSYLFSITDTTAASVSPTFSEFTQTFASILGSALGLTFCMTPVILASAVGTYFRIGYAEKLTNKLSKFQFPQK